MQGKLGGGPFVSQVLEQMQLFVANDTNKLPFIHYSGHDSSLQAILAALKLSSDYAELQELPPYGSAIVFELHKNNNQYSVKVVWKRQFDGPFKVYALKSLTDGATTGCADACPFDSFKSYVLQSLPNMAIDWSRVMPFPMTGAVNVAILKPMFVWQHSSKLNKLQLLFWQSFW